MLAAPRARARSGNRTAVVARPPRPAAATRVRSGAQPQPHAPHPPPRFGLGFRRPWFAALTTPPRRVDWLEVVTESVLGTGGPRRAMLERLRADYPIALHGVGLSIAGTAPIPRAYLDALRALVVRLDPAYVSDHLCWTGRRGRTTHDLFPVAPTRALLDHVAARVARVQDALGRRLLLENPSAYVAFRRTDMNEADFLAELCVRTGCGVLLDVNNLVVNAANLGTDPQRCLAALPPGAVGYLHLAGHAVLPDVRIDTHDAPVPPEVWTLFADAARRFPHADVIVERDDRLPPFEEMVAEVDAARARHAAALAGLPPALPAAAIPRPAARPPGARPPAPRRPPAAWTACQRVLWRLVAEAPADPSDADAPLLARWFAPGLPVPPARGLRVYREAFSATMRRALAANLPALARVLGAADFAALADAYARAHPPRGHDVRAIGADLPGFLRSFPLAGDYGVPREALADLVALEQAQLEALDAPDEPAAVTRAHLAVLTPGDWERARFGFARAVRLVPVTHAVLPAVDAVAKGEPPPRPVPMAGAYLVMRAGAGLRTEPLDPATARCLAGLMAGRTFAAACRAAVRATGADRARVVTGSVAALVTLADHALLTGLRLQPRPGRTASGTGRRRPPAAPL